MSEMPNDQRTVAVSQTDSGEDKPVPGDGKEAVDNQYKQPSADSQESEVPATQPYEADDQQPDPSTAHGVQSSITSTNSQGQGTGESGTQLQGDVPEACAENTSGSLLSFPSTASSNCELTQPYMAIDGEAGQEQSSRDDNTATRPATQTSQTSEQAQNLQHAEDDDGGAATQPFKASDPSDHMNPASASTAHGSEAVPKEGVELDPLETGPHTSTEAGDAMRKEDAGDETIPGASLPDWLQGKRFKFVVGPQSDEAMEMAETEKIPRKRKRLRPTASSDEEDAGREQNEPSSTEAEAEEEAAVDPLDWRERLKFLVRVLPPNEVVAALGPAKAKKLKGTPGLRWTPEEEGLTEETFHGLQGRMMKVLQDSKFNKLTR